MAGILPRSLARTRWLWLGLFAIALMLRIGGPCEAMATAPTMLAAHPAHCAETPAKPGKPLKAAVAACGLCVAIPVAIPASVGAAARVMMEPVAGLPDRLASLDGSPAPPPPRIA